MRLLRLLQKPLDHLRSVRAPTSRQAAKTDIPSCLYPACVGSPTSPFSPSPGQTASSSEGGYREDCSSFQRTTLPHIYDSIAPFATTSSFPSSRSPTSPASTPSSTSADHQDSESKRKAARAGDILSPSICHASSRSSSHDDYSHDSALRLDLIDFELPQTHGDMTVQIPLKAALYFCENVRQLPTAPRIPSLHVKTLGDGGYGSVGLHVEPSRASKALRHVAIKKIPWENEKGDVTADRILMGQWETIVTERMQGAKHAVQIEDAWDDLINEKTCIKMQYAPGRDLLSIVNDHRLHGTWNAKTIAAVACQILLMLQEMQDRAVCHADIKTENIIVGYDGKMTLIDFGLSLIDGVQMFPGAGTLHFMPPEAKRPVPHITPKADIFAVGQTLEVLVESLCDPDSNTPEMVDFIKRCTHPNMKCRADLRELQQHVFVRKYSGGDDAWSRDVLKKKISPSRMWLLEKVSKWSTRTLRNKARNSEHPSPLTRKRSLFMLSAGSHDSHPST